MSQRTELYRAQILKSEFHLIAKNSTKFIKNVRKRRFLVHGGTGFVGKWIVSTILFMNEYYGTENEITIVTRNIDNARKILEIKENDAVKLIELDLGLKEQTFPKKITYDYYICGITPTITSTGSDQKELVLKSTFNSMSSLISNAVKNLNSNPMILNLSSGAVYDRTNIGNFKYSEGDPTEKSGNEYSLAKKISENQLIEASLKYDLKFINARLFAFTGPHLALNEHFAIGNFMNFALKGQMIQMTGSPNTLRSYLHPTDLMIYLFKLLIFDENLTVNVGSDVAVSMQELAEYFASHFHLPGIKHFGLNAVPSFYVPNTDFLRQLTKFSPIYTWQNAIANWYEWLLCKQKSV